MFKRQFYAVDHADNGDDPSSSDSSVNSSSDEDSGHEEEEEEEDDASSPSRGEDAAGSEDSDSEDGDGEPRESASEDEEWDAYRDRNVKVVQSIDSSDFLRKKPVEAATEGVEDSETEKVGEERVGDGVVLRVGGVFKCRLCVKVMCLSDETMRAHLLSKRHVRSLKLLAAGKLKVQLNSDGEEEEEGETHAERLSRIRSIAEEKVVPVKRKADSGRQRQRKRAKQRLNRRAGKAERKMAKQK